MGLKIDDNIMRFVENNASAMDRALNRMVVDIERGAKATVPVSPSGGHLKASGHHAKRGFMKYIVQFDKEYAAFQEWGGDGKRVVRKYSTPGTGKFYLRDAGRSVAGRALDYLKTEARSVRV